MRIEPFAKEFERSDWPPALAAFGLALTALLVLYWQTAVSMAAIWWRSDTFAHGMLVIPIVLYMVWGRRNELAELQPRSHVLGAAALLLLSMGWLVAYAADVLVIQQLALVAMAPALVCAILGLHVVWALAFPLAYLFFAVPAGEALVSPMQDFTAWFTVRALQLTGIPVFWEGRHLLLPSGSFEVAEACSGLRYLIASVALGCLYAYLSYRSLWRRAAFIALAVAVPIAANGVRAYSIVLLAHLSDHRLAVGVDHLVYGWVFFGLVMLLLFWVGSWWREDTEPRSSESTLRATPSALSVTSKHGAAALLAASLTAIALGPLGAAWLNRDVSDVALSVLVPPEAPAGWSGPQSSTDNWAPSFQGAEVVHRIYSLDGRSVHLYIAYYQRQRQGAELINSGNTLYDGKRWIYIDSRTRTLAAEQRPIQELVLGSGSRKRLVWHWYWIGGRETVSPIAAKLLEAWERLSGQDRGSALVAVAADYEIDQAEAETLLTRFLNAAGSSIELALKVRR